MATCCQHQQQSGDLTSVRDGPAYKKTAKKNREYPYDRMKKTTVTFETVLVRPNVKLYTWLSVSSCFTAFPWMHILSDDATWA